MWWGVAALPAGDGVVGLAPADRAGLLRPAPSVGPGRPRADRARRPRRRCTAAAPSSSATSPTAWAPARRSRTTPTSSRRCGPSSWSGYVTNDGWAALRARTSGGTAPRRSLARGGVGMALPRRSGPPAASGRWSLLAGAITQRRRAGPGGRRCPARALRDRHPRRVVAERIEGGFAARLQGPGRLRGRRPLPSHLRDRGSGSGAVRPAGRRRSDAGRRSGAPAQAGPVVVVLAATDPANAYGAALPWPPVPGSDVTHRPGRKAGAIVVLVDGAPDRCTWSGAAPRCSSGRTTSDVLEAAVRALAHGGPGSRPGRGPSRKVNGRPIAEQRSLARALVAAGFLATPRGLPARRGRDAPVGGE